MRMKNIVLLCCVFLLTLNGYSQEANEEKSLLNSIENSITISTISIVDPYLSPLKYQGLDMGYHYENRRFLRPDNLKISKQTNFNLFGGMALNPAYTASMIFGGGDLGWGLHYHFRPISNLQLLAGGLWDVNFTYKMVGRNTNNPINVDLASNLNFSGIARYDFRLYKKSLRLQLNAKSPVVGCMFVPMGGASYYEMFKLWNLSSTTHFSTLHNKRGLNSTLSVYVPFKHSVWKFGIGYNGLKYEANDLIFKQNELSILIGTTFERITFAGKNNKAPRNFISTND